MVNTVDWTICPKCKKREREIAFDGEMEMYCEVCNDRLADSYRQMKEFREYHNDN